MNNNIHTVLLIVGRTGSGKSSIIKKLCENTTASQLISYTTRPKRNEFDNDHIFVDKNDYYDAKASGQIVAETEIAGNYYYSTVDQIYKNDIYTIDPYGIKVLKNMNLPNIKFVVVYISCSLEEREKRAVEYRGDDVSTFRIRDFSESSQFREFVMGEEWDYSIKNVNLAKAYSTLRWIADIEGIDTRGIFNDNNG